MRKHIFIQLFSLFPIFLWPSSLLTGTTLTVMGLSIYGRPGDHPSIPPAWTCTLYFWCHKIEYRSRLCRINISAFPPTTSPNLHFLSTEYYYIEVWGLAKKKAKCRYAARRLLTPFRPHCTGSTLPQDVCVLFFPQSCEGPNIPPSILNPSFVCCFNTSHQSKMDRLPLLYVTKGQISTCKRSPPL